MCLYVWSINPMLCSWFPNFNRLWYTTPEIFFAIYSLGFHAFGTDWISVGHYWALISGNFINNSCKSVVEHGNWTFVHERGVYSTIHVLVIESRIYRASWVRGAFPYHCLSINVICYASDFVFLLEVLWWLCRWI